VSEQTHRQSIWSIKLGVIIISIVVLGGAFLMLQNFIESVDLLEEQKRLLDEKATTVAIFIATDSALAEFYASETSVALMQTQASNNLYATELALTQSTLLITPEVLPSNTPTEMLTPTADNRPYVTLIRVYSSGNLRTGPGMNYGITHVFALRGELLPLYDLATAEDGTDIIWYLVEKENTLGWISSAIVEVVNPSRTPISIDEITPQATPNNGIITVMPATIPADVTPTPVPPTEAPTQVQQPTNQYTPQRPTATSRPPRPTETQIVPTTPVPTDITPTIQPTNILPTVVPTDDPGNQELSCSVSIRQDGDIYRVTVNPSGGTSPYTIAGRVTLQGGGQDTFSGSSYQSGTPITNANATVRDSAGREISCSA